MSAELSSKEVASLKAAAQDLEVALQVGKGGLSEGIVGELAAALDRAPLVKVRLLKSALESGDRKDLASELAERAGATLVEVRGHTAVFYKPPKGRRRKS